MGVEGEAGARTDRSAARHGTDDAEMSAVSGVHAEQYAAVMLATTSDGVWAFDRDGRILEVNEAYCRMSGYSREELLSMRIAELEAIQSETEIAQHICRCMEAGFIRFESRHRAKDGQLFDVEVSAGYAPDQGRFVLFARDITERNRAEAEQRWLAAVVESSGDAIMSSDPDGITSWNPGAEQLYGYSAEEVIGRPITMLAPDELREELVGFRERAHRGETIPPFETRRRRKDGSLVDVSILPSLVRDASGAVVGTCAIHRDITERRRRDRQLRAIVDLGFQALRQLSFLTLVEIAARAIADTLDVEMVWVAESQPEGELLVRAGVGLERGAAGELRLGGGRRSLSGYTLRTGGPVVSADLLEDRRFEPWPTLLELGARSAACVVVGPPEHRYGVLGASAPRTAHFSDDDLVFLETVSNILAASLQRVEAERAVRISAEQYQSILVTTRDGFCLLEPGGQIVDVNEAYCRMLGYEREELLGQDVTTLDAALSEAELAEVIDRVGNRGFARFETKHRANDGHAVDVEVTISHCREQDRFVHFIRDISERKQAEAELADIRELLDRSQALSKTGGWEWDIPTGQLTWTDEVYEIYGLEKSGSPSDPERVFAFYDEDSRSRLGPAFERAVTGESFDLELGLTRADGERILVRIIGEPVSEDGQVVRVVGNIVDVTELRRAEAQVRESQQRLQSIVDHAPAVIYLTDLDGRFLLINSELERILGVPREDVLGRTREGLLDAGTAAQHRMNDLEVLRTERALTFEEEIPEGDAEHTFLAVKFPLRSEDVQIYALGGICTDITERKRLERELKFYADHDPLTGLFNRRRLGEELAERIAQAERYGESTGLLVGDVDNFKYVNDSLGHKAGDQFIKGIARVIDARLRDTDVLARLGGDEFAIVLPRTSLAQATLVAQSLRQAVQDYQVAMESHRVRATISFGVTAIEGAQLKPDDALVIADLAMYEAKQQGRDRIATARPGAIRDRAERILHWSERVRSALAEQRFELYAQPIVALTSAGTDGYELLLRMHGDSGIVLPSAFIDTAERYGVIGEIDRWVITNALRIAARHRVPETTFAVNLSGASMSDRELLALIEQTIDTLGVDPARLIFEVTETAAIADLDAARGFVEHLHRVGCAVALDDFGSGFGSFTYLKYLPIDYLKIDGDFIRQLPDSLEDRLLVKAIVDVARGLGKQTIAEHTGSDETIALLREYGVNYAQGFHLGTPQPVESGG